MKRETLFRGKRIDDGEWIEGSLLVTKFNTYIIPMYDEFIVYQMPISVDSETVGQFTGLTDKNGVRIFEGDIVQWTFGKHYWEAVISVAEHNKSNTLYAIEIYHNCTKDENDFYTYERSDSRRGTRNDVEFLSRNIEIIGNIHDNPELLK